MCSPKSVTFLRYPHGCGGKGRKKQAGVGGDGDMQGRKGHGIGNTCLLFSSCARQIMGL